MRNLALMWVLAGCLLGCGGGGTQWRYGEPPVMKESFYMELDDLLKEYKKQFGKELFFRFGTYLNSNDEEDILAVLKQALRSDKPFPNHRKVVEEEDLYMARFNWKIPDCQYAYDECKDNTPVPPFLFNDIDTIDCRCGENYLFYILTGARSKNEPLQENIIVTKLDLWMALYERLFSNESFPAWFQELSYKDKIMHLNFAVGTGLWDWSPFLSKEKEDSIKVVLEKVIVEKENKLDREMTELEKAKIEYEIQFRKQAPICECSDEEWLMYLKYCIKYNREWLYDEPITKDQVRYVIDGKWWDERWNDIKKRYKEMNQK